MTHPESNDETIRAGIVAHAICLGKCPTPGMVIGFSLQIKTSTDPAVLDGDLSSARDLTEKVPVDFRVTAVDIANVIILINEQLIAYREPMTSVMPLRRASEEP